MSDTKELTETLKQLTDALEAGSKTYTKPAALQVDDRTELLKKYLNPESLKAIGLPKATQLIRFEKKGVCSHRVVFYGVRVRTDQIEKGVEKMASIINDLASKGQIHSFLATCSSLELFRLPGEVQTSVVVCYPMVPIALAEELDRTKPKYIVSEGDSYPASDDPNESFRLELPSGQFMAYVRVSHFSSMADNDHGYEVSGTLFKIVQDHLKLLPEGTKFLGANKCAITDLSVPYELFFENKLLQNVSRIELDYVRDIAVLEKDVVEQFNRLMGIRYYDKNGKLR